MAALMAVLVLRPLRSAYANRLSSPPATGKLATR
jgi:hypothetical protein